MKEMTYKQYLNSSEWRRKARQAKDRAGRRCQLCNAGPGLNKLHAHHRTYERLGHEWDTDLTVLCEDCHKLFHKRSGIIEHDFVMIAKVELITLKKDGLDILL